MKNYIDENMFKWMIFTILIPILLLSSNVSFSQEEAPLRIYLDIVCYQKNTGKDLKASVRARTGEDRKIMPVRQATG